jgi:hypothetical protein
MSDDDIEKIKNRKLSDVIGGSVDSNEKSESKNNLNESTIIDAPFIPEKDPLKRKLQEMNRKRDEKTSYSLKKLRERKNKIVEARENSKGHYKGSKANLIEIHITLLLSLLGGMIGADRAYKGQFGLAFLKFITLGGLGLWVIIDIWINALEARESWHQYYICLDEDKPDEEA